MPPSNTSVNERERERERTNKHRCFKGVHRQMGLDQNQDSCNKSKNDLGKARQPCLNIRDRKQSISDKNKPELRNSRSTNKILEPTEKHVNATVARAFRFCFLRIQFEAVHFPQEYEPPNTCGDG